MSGLSPRYLCSVPLLAAALACPSKAAAQGHCCCRPSAGVSVALLPVLQAVQLQALQQQYLQTVQLDGLVRDLAAQGPGGVKNALANQQAEVRWAAARLAGTQGLPLHDELIDLLTDSHAQVRQAARQSLVQLSARAQSQVGRKRLAARRKVDFGPTPYANASSQAKAQQQWRDWWARNHN